MTGDGLVEECPAGVGIDRLHSGHRELEPPAPEAVDFLESADVVLVERLVGVIPRLYEGAVVDASGHGQEELRVEVAVERGNRPKGRVRRHRAQLGCVTAV